MFQKILNLMVFAGMVFMNYLANALPLNGKTTGQLSELYPNLFVPAGITFSIWGLIYILLLIFCIIQFRKENSPLLQYINRWFIVTCVLNAAWIIAWHYEQLPFSLLIMLGLLVSLIFINLALKDFAPGVIKAAFGIYLGWICIATVANVTALLVNFNWQGFGISPVVWTVALIFIGALIASLAVIRFNSIFIALSVIWAFAGIILKRQEDFISIVIAAALAILVVLVVSVYQGFRKDLPVVQ